MTDKTKDNEQQRKLDESLLEASAKGDVEAVKTLLKQGASVSGVDRLRETALHKAARRGHTEVVKALLEAKANPNALDLRGETPMHEAAKSGNISSMRLLRRYGGKYSIKDENGVTPIHHLDAICGLSREVISALSDTNNTLAMSGKDITVQDKQNRNVILQRGTSRNA